MGGVRDSVDGNLVSSQTHGGSNPQMTPVVDDKPRSRTGVTLGQHSAKNKDTPRKHLTPSKT